jgi:hypothetical protein
MNISDEECIRVRTDVWLLMGENAPVKVQTRSLCRDGVFLEFTGRIAERSVGVVFPDGRDPALGNGHIAGTVFHRWPDGVWIRFDRTLRSISELLMRNSLALPPAGATRASGRRLAAGVDGPAMSRFAAIFSGKGQAGASAEAPS